MSLDKAILEVVENKLKDGFMEKMIEEQLEKGINSALSSAFNSYGDVTKVIEKKIKEVMVPYVEKYDYSEYITKIDHVLVSVLEEAALPHKKIMENFKDLIDFKAPGKIKVSEIFDKWCDYVAKNIDTSNLDVDYDDEPTYYNSEVTLEVDDIERSRYSSREEAEVVFECGEDQKMNKVIRLYQWKDSVIKGWRLELDENITLNSLQHLDSFTIFLMQLKQAGTEIEVDTHCDSTEVEVEAKPEPEWN